MIIRDATINDAEAVTRIQVAAWQAAYPGMIPAKDLAAFTSASSAPALSLSQP